MKMRTAWLSVAHFGVDFACAALYFGFLSGTPNWWIVLLLYNACAFAAQMPIGLFADAWNRNLSVAAIGVLLVALAYPFASVPIAAAVLAGLGNGAFHVGAGLEVMNDSGRKAGPLGVFVSPGAVGLYLGTAHALWLKEYPWIVLSCLAVCVVCIVLSARCGLFRPSDNAPLSIELPKGTLLPLIALVLVVVLRSALGFTNAFSAPNVPKMIGVLCVAAGKAAGGLIGDRVGMKTTSIVSLAACAVLLAIPSDFAHLAALFAFNMTMPLTLWGAARRLNRAKGFSFGLLTFALFLGFLPRLMGIVSWGGVYWHVGAVLLSLGLLTYGLKDTGA